MDRRTDAIKYIISLLCNANAWAHIEVSQGGNSCNIFLNYCENREIFPNYCKFTQPNCCELQIVGFLLLLLLLLLLPLLFHLFFLLPTFPFREETVDVIERDGTH